MILGDQLDPSTTVTLGLRKDRDAIVMAEVREESTSPPSHKQRTAMFLGAMRRRAADLIDKGWEVRYSRITDKQNTHTLAGELERAIDALSPAELHIVRPGDWRVLHAIEEVADRTGLPLTVHEDPHFTATIDDFGAWSHGKKQLTMEYYYRSRRKALNILMDGDAPTGGEWNYDKDNRKAFKNAPDPPSPPTFEIDRLMREVMADIDDLLPDLPGRWPSDDRFPWPTTPEEAKAALTDFIEHRLPSFGDYQDAMWKGQRTLYHSLLSPAMNLKLLDPMDAVSAAVGAYERGDAPLNAVEGFVRQIIGWREFIRGIYWTQGPEYAELNGLKHTGDLPEFYWTGDTDMACMADALSSVIELSYGHHIARLMITGNFALIAAIEPRQVHEWYLGMYADGVDWVTLPNTVGMALHADGAIVGTKPYASSGKYIQRMGNFCKSCKYDIKGRAGDDACPFNTFYWDFLIRHRERFSSNNRMAMVLKNLDRIDDDELTQITVSAKSLRKAMGITR